MDEQTRTKARRAARRWHWLAQVLILFCLGDYLISYGIGVQRAEMFLESKLNRAYWNFRIALSKYHSDRWAELLTLPPPRERAERMVWAQKVEEHLEAPAAVFTKSGRHVDWLRTPPSLTDKLPAATAILLGDTLSKRWHKPDTILNYVMRGCWFGDSTDVVSISYAGSLTDSLRWGIVFSDTAKFRPYLARLARASDMGLLDPLESYVYQDFHTNNSGGMTGTPNFRASVNSEPLYASPEFDSTKIVYSHDWSGLRMDFNLGYFDEPYVHALRHRPESPWIQFAIFCVISAALAIIYRKVLSLTLTN
jgi:hypothetical protein